ncbi:hypothetical protein Cgig2_002853 [Carnegiea gigantea]|uniref:DC1 domain-containing protein n=1 Tax=Carnegiea gigantea TaxID=171969 RepID=A0A9Q1KPW9_9CARY|nr:hypothetical protein Cgig2_002853 [Carnegiea gigantea]
MACSGDRRVMKLKDKELEKERARGREIEKETADDNPPEEIIEHFSHCHPLTYTKADYAGFHCNICTQNNTEPSMSHQGEVINTTFAHPEHPVVAEFSKQSFRCDHCNNSGKGLRFICRTCNAEFHPVCTKNPSRLTAHLHQHELELKLRPYNTICNLCGTKGSKNNRMYRCKLCGFYLHSGCSEWPLYLVGHPLHPDHPLMFKSCDGIVQCCSACKMPMDGYKYSCGICYLDFDPRCVWSKSSEVATDEEMRQKYAGQQIRELPAINLSMANNLSGSHDSHVDPSGAVNLLQCCLMVGVCIGT